MRWLIIFLALFMLGAPSRVSARLHQRLQIVKMASGGKLNVEIAATLSVDPQRVRRWRKRWARGGADSCRRLKSAGLRVERWEAGGTSSFVYCVAHKG